MSWSQPAYFFLLLCLALSISPTTSGTGVVEPAVVDGYSQTNGSLHPLAPAEAQNEGGYYVEFRARFNFTPGGHTLVAYGHLNPDGSPKDMQIASFYPEGGPWGFLSGFAILVPATLDAVWGDRTLPTIASYRKQISAAQYDRLLQFVADARSQQQSWNLFSSNCNKFAGKLARHIGLRAPKFAAIPADVFVSAIYLANE
jgi:hypothetical protein